MSDQQTEEMREGVMRGWCGDGSMVDIETAALEVGEEFDAWLLSVKADAWHEGACNYYEANPYGTQAKDA